MAQTEYKVNDRVEVLYQGKWYKATVLKTDKGRYFVHWDGYSASYDSWAKQEEVRPMGTTTNTTTTNSTTTNSNTTNNTTTSGTKYKVGDKVVYMVQEFPEGTILGFKNGYCILDIADPMYRDQGKQGIEEKWLLDPWQYKEFYAELKKLTNRPNNNLKDLFATSCGECAPDGWARKGAGTVNMGTFSQAVTDFNDFKAFVNKYSFLPDTKRNYFTLNPSLAKKAANQVDSVLNEWFKIALSERIQNWKSFNGMFYDLTHESMDPNHVLANGRYAEDFVMCGTFADVKTILTENIKAAYAKYKINGNPDELLVGFEEAFQNRKTKLLSESNENGWVKSDYPFAENSLVAQIQKASSSNLKVLKVFYNATAFDVKKDDYGYITEQAKGGVVIYQKQGCDYWMWQTITVFKPYKGNGTYGPTEIRYFDYGYIKPF